MNGLALPTYHMKGRKAKMKRGAIVGILLGTVMSLTPITVQAGTVSRMYNPNSGESFYTENTAEKNYLNKIGWDEDFGWKTPDQGKPVYRLYNTNMGDHHFTMSAGERDALVKLGWDYEGVGWRSGGTVPVYRLYNPERKISQHVYTADETKTEELAAAGWNYEGVAWYGVTK